MTKILFIYTNDWYIVCTETPESVVCCLFDTMTSIRRTIIFQHMTFFLGTSKKWGLFFYHLVKITKLYSYLYFRVKLWLTYFSSTCFDEFSSTAYQSDLYVLDSQFPTTSSSCRSPELESRNFTSNTLKSRRIHPLYFLSLTSLNRTLPFLSSSVRPKSSIF